MALCYSLLVAYLWCTSPAQCANSCYYHTRKLPEPMYGHLAAYNPTKNAVYLFGGRSNGRYLTSIYKWDLNSPDSWFTPIGSIPTAVLFSWSANGNSVFVENKVFFFGAGDGSDMWATSGNVHVYDTNTEQWRNTDDFASPPLPVLIGGCLAQDENHIFMADGFDWDEIYDPRPPPHVYIYSIADNLWTSQLIDSEMAPPRGWAQQYCSLIDDELYILGGIDVYQKLLNVIYRMNIQTLQVEKLSATLPLRLGVGIGHDNLIYLIGSHLDAGMQEIIAFDTTTESLFTAFTTQESFCCAAVLKINNKIYRFGGRVVDDATDSVEICDLPTKTPTTAAPSTQPSASPTTVTPTTTSPTTASPTTTEPTRVPTTEEPSTTTTTHESTNVAPITRSPTTPLPVQTAAHGTSTMAAFGDATTTLMTTITPSSTTSSSASPSSSSSSPLTSISSTRTIVIIAVCASAVFAAVFCVCAVGFYYTREKEDERRLSENNKEAADIGDAYVLNKTKAATRGDSIGLEIAEVRVKRVVPYARDIPNAVANQPGAGEPDFEQENSVDDDNRDEGRRASMTTQLPAGLSNDEFEVVDENQETSTGNYSAKPTPGGLEEDEFEVVDDKVVGINSTHRE